MRIRLLYGQIEINFFDEDRALADIKASGLDNYEEIYSRNLEYKYPPNFWKSIAEKYFQLTNDPSRDEINPLASSEIQTIIKKSKAHHTSMSIGDIVGLSDDEGPERFFLCMGSGFDEIEVKQFKCSRCTERFLVADNLSDHQLQHFEDDEANANEDVNVNEITPEYDESG